MPSEAFKVNWVKHHEVTKDAMWKQLTDSKFTDCIISCEGKLIKAHRVILASSSTYFEELFTTQLDLTTPSHGNVVIFHDFFKYEDICDLLEFVYLGEVIVPSERLEHFLEVGNFLKIHGLVRKANAIIPPMNLAKTSYATTTEMEEEEEITASPMIGHADLKLEMISEDQKQGSEQTEMIELLPEKPSKLVAIKRRSKPTEMTEQLPEKPSKLVAIKRRKINKILPKLFAKKKNISSEFAKVPSLIPEEPKTDVFHICQFCSRIYKTKISCQSHQRECIRNPNKVEIACPTCNLKMKPSAMHRHKRLHQNQK